MGTKPQVSEVLAGEFVPEDNMVVFGVFDQQKSDKRTRAIILSTLPVFRKKGNSVGVIHSEHFFLGLPQTFDTEIIGVPWSSEQMLDETTQANDLELLDYMEERSGWRMAALLNGDLYIDADINKSPAAIDQLTLFETKRRFEKMSVGKRAILHYLDTRA
jgi:hypothetical protein